MLPVAVPVLNHNYTVLVYKDDIPTASNLYDQGWIRSPPDGWNGEILLKSIYNFTPKLHEAHSPLSSYKDHEPQVKPLDSANNTIHAGDLCYDSNREAPGE